MFAVRFCLSVLLLSAALSGVAHAQLCDPLLRPNRVLPWCPAVQLGNDLGEARADWRAAKERYAQDLSEKIAVARQRFESLKEGAVGYQEARATLEDLLVKKDFWYLEQEEPLVMRGALDTFMKGFFNAQVDGGIRPFARAWFSTWENFLRDRVRGDRHQPLEQAIEDSRPIYEHYRLARQWAESSALGKMPTNDPVQYGQLLVTLESPWVVMGYASDRNYPKTVATYYETLQAVFGPGTVEQAVKATMALPKDRDGFVSPPLEMNGRKWADPSKAFRALLGKDRGRNLMILTIMEDRHDLSASGMRNALEEYTRWTAGYGAKPVDDTALSVASLAKDENNLVRDAGPIGFPTLRSEHPYNLTQKILIVTDPVAYARTILAFHDNLLSAESAQAAFNSLSARNGQKAVADAAKALSGLWVTGEYLPPNGDRTLADVRFSAKPNTGPESDYSLLMGILNGTVTLARGTQIDNPHYSLWAKYKPGTTITYEQRAWWLKDGQLIPSPVDHNYTLTTWRLKALDAEAATVEYSSQRFTAYTEAPRKQELRYGAHVNSEETPEALMEAVQKRQQTYAGTEQGTESLSVGGKMIPCHWSKVEFRHSTNDVETNKTWTSDQIPGGLVMTARNRGATVDRTVIKSVSIDEGKRAAALASSSPITTTAEGPALARPSHKKSEELNTVARSSAATGSESISIPAGTPIMITLNDTIDSSFVESGKKAGGRLSRAISVSGEEVAREGSDVVLVMRKMPSYATLTQIAISVESIAAGAQTIFVSTNEITRAFPNQAAQRYSGRRAAPALHAPNGLPAGTMLYFRVRALP